MVELLAQMLGLDPREEAALHLELAERLLEGGDAVQASERLYGAAEECVKAMAEALGVEEAAEARRRGRWTLRLLDRAAFRLSRLVDRRV